MDLYLSYQDVQSLIRADYDGKDVFVKDMIVGVTGCFEELFSNHKLHSFTNTFFIRSPEKTMVSFYRAFTKDIPHAEFNGGLMVTFYEKMLDFYNFIAGKLKQPPIIVDADDLLSSPEKMLRKYCDLTGLTYHENMLSWKLPPSNEMKRVPWQIFHRRAQESSGFHPPKQTDHSDIPEAIMKHIDECIVKCQEPYKVMYDRRLKI